MKKSELRQLIKEEIDNIHLDKVSQKMTEPPYNVDFSSSKGDNNNFKIDVDLAFKIYDILSWGVDGFKQAFPVKSHFYHFLNNFL